MKDLLNQFLGGPSTERGHITLGGVPVPADLEPLHFLLAGSTGTGKTTLVTEMLDAIVARGDRVIVCDPAGHHMTKFAKKSDRILNPLDRRAQCWSIFNEIRKDFDYDRLARSLIPNGHGSDKQWHSYAQVLCSEAMRALMLRGEGDTARLLHWLTVAKVDALAELLAGTPAQGLLDKDAAKALASTRFIVTTQLNPHKYLKHGDFSLRSWLETERGNLYLTWREDMQTALMPLVGSWVDILCNAVLSLPADPNRRIWLVLDELGALGHLNSLESALMRGRKHGLCVVGGLQSTAQLDQIYGRDGGIVLRSCFRNLVALGIAKIDPDTSDLLSRALGERVVDKMQFSRNHGANGISTGESVQRAQERIVMASQIAGLPNLHAYLALAGDEPVRRITITPRDLPSVTQPFEE